MENEDRDSLKQTERIKYKPSKAGKGALAVAIGSLAIGLIIVILSVLSIVNGFIMLIALILSHTIAIIAFVVLAADVIKFNKINHVNESSDSKMVLGLVIGIIIGFMWGKIL